LYGSASGLSFVPAVRKAPPYDPLRDFTPIALQFVVQYVLYVHAGLPVHSLRELIDYAHAHPGKLSYGTGTATAFLTMNELLASTKSEMVHVPYKGEVSAQADLLTGRIQVMFATPSSFLAHMKAGSIRAIASSDARRSALDPDVPTLTELGIDVPKVLPWVGLLGPAGLPKDIVERLSRAFVQALQEPEVREQLAKLGFVPTGSSPAELATLLKEQLELMHGAVRDGHVAAD
jgi:tripartite-type tricarboxylate transporter receptor subunit TctC